MTIFNGTPHIINIISKDCVNYNKEIRKFITDKPVITKSIEFNYLLNAQFEQVEGESVEGIPVSYKKIVSATDKPDADVIICSALYYIALKELNIDISNCYTIIDPVFDVTGRTVLGSLAIGKV